jgi:flagellin
MALTITNNIASLTAQDNLSRTSSALSQSLERLSSGLKINRGADGPAALVISEQQRAQINGLQAAINNTTKAVNVVQIAEGGLNEVSSLLLQIRGLAVDSANAGVNDTNSLAANQAEIANALNTINQIATSTQFGTKQLLDGSRAINATISSDSVANNTAVTASGTLPTGAYNLTVASAATKATLTGGAAAATTTSAETVTVNGVNVQIASGVSAANQVIAINTVSTQTGVTASLNGGGNLVLTANRFGSAQAITSSVAVAGGGADTTGLAAGTTFVAGLDVTGSINGGPTLTGVGNTLSQGGLTATFTNGGTVGETVAVSVDASRALVFQIGANAGQTASIAIDRAAADSLGKGASATFTSLNAIDVTNTANSAAVLTVVDKSINDVSSLRGRIGAFQTNQLEATANNLRTTLENTTAAESNIRDTDFAAETANFTKNQVLIQAGTSVLQNANQTSQLVLALLK